MLYLSITFSHRNHSMTTHNQPFPTSQPIPTNQSLPTNQPTLPTPPYQPNPPYHPTHPFQLTPPYQSTNHFTTLSHTTHQTGVFVDCLPHSIDIRLVSCGVERSFHQLYVEHVSSLDVYGRICVYFFYVGWNIKDVGGLELGCGWVSG